jgi:hypothetical protein
MTAGPLNGAPSDDVLRWRYVMCVPNNTLMAPRRRGWPRVTCVGLSVKALLAWGSGLQALVKVERPQRSEDVRP